MTLDKEALDKLRIEPSARGASSFRLPGWLAWAPVPALFLVAGYWWWSERNELPVVEVVRVEAASAGSSVGDAVLNATGYVVARRLATVSSKVTGKIVEVLVEEGMAVEEGQVLAQLDDSTVRRLRELAVSQLEVARRSLEEVRVRRAEAKRSLRRAENLRADNLVSEAELDAAAAEVDALEARLQALQGELEVAQRTVALRDQDLDDLVIRAPFAGVVISKNAQPGEMISPTSAGGGFTRTGIATIVDMDSREIEVDVNEAYINRVHADQKVEARLDAYPDWIIPARVISIVPTADRQRATVRVRLGFDELDPRILPDMGVKVGFMEQADAAPPEAPVAVARLPEGAVHRGDGQDYVWVLRDGILERRAVTLGRSNGAMRDVIAGLRPGERVVLAGSGELEEGRRVRLGNPD